MASRSDGVTRLYEVPQAPESERLPQPPKTKDKVLLDERGLLDLPFLALTVLLVLIGVVMVFSASYARAYYLTGNSTYYFARQAIFAVAGIGGMLFVSRLNYQLWRSASFIILAVSVVFLMLVPLIGSTANGAKRWIEVAGIRFQPSELAKIAIIMTFSAMISTYRDKMRTFRYGIAPFGAIMIVLCGLVALERHFSCILIMLLLAAAMLFLGGVQLKWFALGGAAVAVFMFVYLKTQGYAGSRITAWRDPASDPTDNGYQILQSLYAIGSGGLMGLGLGKPTEVPVSSRGAQRLYFPHSLRGTRFCRGRRRDPAVHSSDRARLLYRHARARSLRCAPCRRYFHAYCASDLPQYWCRDELSTRYRHFASVLLLWRHGAAHAAV